MKIYQKICFVIIGSFIFLTFANGQPAAGSEKQKPERAGTERKRNLTVEVENYFDSDILQANQSTGYEMRCRGGNNLSFTKIGEKTHSSGAVIVTLELSFAPSIEAAGANSAGLLPGECSWLDRPLSGLHRTGEPWRIRFETPANAQLKQTQSGSQVDKSRTSAESYPDAVTIPNYLSNPNHFWSFRVSNTGKGFFAANSHQYWKKTLDDRPLPKGGIFKQNF